MPARSATVFLPTLLVLTLCHLTLSPASAQVGPSWQSVAQGATVPTARQNHALAYDSQRLRTVMFGGSDALSIPRPDTTWEWDGSGWLQRTPMMGGPSPRDGHALAYDAARQRVVMFGGDPGGNNVLAETWEWDGIAWTLAAPASSPPARIHFGMAYDSIRQRTVLFGGWSPAAIFGDTWEWDGTNWLLVTTSGAPARSAHAMVYDVHAQRTLLFGGSNPSTAQRDDLWSWDGATWTQITPAVSPGIRHHHTMAYDLARHVTVLQGGCFTGGALRADSWSWDGTNWNQMTGAQVTPSRAFAATTWDATRGRVFLFGGRDGAGGTSSESVLNDASETNLAATWTYGVGCPGSNGVPAIGAVPGSLPILGGQFTLQVSNIPVTGGFFHLAIPFLGFDNTSTGGVPLPRDLTPLGMPGCTQYVDPFLVVFHFTPTGSTLWTLGVPNDPTLSGFRVHFQAAVVDPVNPLGLIASNAATATLGW